MINIQDKFSRKSATRKIPVLSTTRASQFRRFKSRMLMKPRPKIVAATDPYSIMQNLSTNFTHTIAPLSALLWF